MARPLLLALLLASLPLVVGAQTLGEAAARERTKREQKAREGKPPGKVFTNEDLGEGEAAPTDDGSAGNAAAYAPPEQHTPAPAPRSRRRGGEEEDGVAPAEAPAAAEEPARGPAREEDASPWDASAAAGRERLQQSQARVAELERRIEDLRQRLNPTSTRYEIESLEAGDGGLVSRQAELQGQLASAEAELGEERKELEAARQAWEEFARQARAAGAPESVLRDPGR